MRSVLVCTDGSTHAQRATDALLAMPWLNQIDTVRVIGVFHIGIYDDSAEIRTAVDSTIERLTAAPALTRILQPGSSEGWSGGGEGAWWR